MNRALFTGLSGTMSFQSSLNVLASNIVNANTTAYKEQRVSFRDLFYQTVNAGASSSPQLGAISPSQVGSGVGLGQVQSLLTQGALQPTYQPLDAAISGQGYFVLQGPYGSMYTRDGAFTLDDTHTLISAGTGMRVMGWLAEGGQIDAARPVGALSFPVGELRAARATGELLVGGNLDSAAAAGAAAHTGIAVYDSLGNLHQVSLSFTRTGVNTWEVEATCGADSATGELSFDESGALTAGSPLDFALTLTNGAASPQSLQLDFSALSQRAQDFSAVVRSQDGYAPAALLAVELSEGGLLRGRYSDGQSQVLGQVALAGFTNPAALQREGDNLFASSLASGDPQIGTASTGGRGGVVASALELSNVDLTQAFVNMVTSQRGFQASANVIATANSMLEEAIRLAQR